jgi:flagellar export protein FliJ
MAKFRFRLQVLLKLREAARQERRLELAQAYQADELLRQQKEQLAAEKIEMQKRSQVAASPGPVNVDQLMVAHRYGLLLDARTRMLEQQQERLQEEIDRRRQALIEADRLVRVLEKLRDRQLEQHREEEAKQEVKRLDEIAQRQVSRVE